MSKYIDTSGGGSGGSGSSSWGSITGTLANQTDLQEALDDKSNVGHTHTASQVTDFNTAADARITAQKAQADGLATLGADSKVPTSQLPAIALTDVYVVANEAAQLALTAQEGDVAVRTDENKSYVHNGGSAGTMDDWTELLTPTDAVLSVNGQTGAVTLTTSDISEGTNQYFTDERAQDAVGSTLTDTSTVDLTYDDVSGQITADVKDGSITDEKIHTDADVLKTAFGITIDGGGAAITTGVKGYVTIPFDCTIVGWDILADQEGDIVVDVWKDTYANFPPTVEDTIAGTEKPTLSSVQKNQDNSLSSWTTSVSAGDVIAFNVDSVSTVTRVTLIIKVKKN